MLNGKGMYQGLLIPVLSSCLKTTQQAYSWAHFLFLKNLFILFIFGCIGSSLLRVGFL